MGDGIQKKFAIIINGDGEARHLENVETAIRALRAEEKSVPYQISVASPQRPRQAVDRYIQPRSNHLPSLLDGLKNQMDEDDLLTIYVTGHGGKTKEGKECTALA